MKPPDAEVAQSDAVNTPVPFFSYKRKSGHEWRY
jgi:hypothetical protein